MCDKDQEIARLRLERDSLQEKNEKIKQLLANTETENRKLLVMIDNLREDNNELRRLADGLMAAINTDACKIASLREQLREAIEECNKTKEDDPPVVDVVRGLKEQLRIAMDELRFIRDRAGTLTQRAYSENARALATEILGGAHLAIAKINELEGGVEEE